jgi:hypothetical protein
VLFFFYLRKKCANSPLSVAKNKLDTSLPQTTTEYFLPSVFPIVTTLKYSVRDEHWAVKRERPWQHVIVGWFKFITATRVRSKQQQSKKLRYINNSGIYSRISISLSVAKISQWSVLLLCWAEIHLSNSVYSWSDSLCCNFGGSSLVKGLFSFVFCICLWKALVALSQCLLALTSVKETHSLNRNMWNVCLQVISVWYSLKVNFSDRKYKAWNIAGSDFRRKDSMPQLSLGFICRPQHARILQILRSFAVFLTDTHSA